MLPAQITCYVLPYLTEKPLFSMEQQAAHFAECPVVTKLKIAVLFISILYPCPEVLKKPCRIRHFHNSMNDSHD